MMMVMRGFVVLLPLVLAGTAHAARLVILPVVVGTSSEPPPVLMNALADGLREASRWSVVMGADLKPLLAEQNKEEPNPPVQTVPAQGTTNPDTDQDEAGPEPPAQAVPAPQTAAVSAPPDKVSSPMDTAFAQQFTAEEGQRIRFASSSERRQLEDSYARRVAERYGADIVVFASVGVMGGADWLNARLYLRSGYRNRQGLVRLDEPRARSLGRYLAIGKATPDVVRPEDANALVIASSDDQLAQPAQPSIAPWYSDWIGWSFLAIGAAGVGVGAWQHSEATAQYEKSTAIKNDSLLRARLRREASGHEFLSNIGLIGGGIGLATGAILLAIPQYTSLDGQLFTITPVTGGTIATVAGNF
jgi:hypothetical protein